MSNYWERMNELSEELRVYAENEGCELGDYWLSLMELARFNYCFGDEFEAHIISELEYQVNKCKTQCEIVHHEDEVKTIRRWSELVWYDE